MMPSLCSDNALILESRYQFRVRPRALHVVAGRAQVLMLLIWSRADAVGTPIEKLSSPDISLSLHVVVP